MEADSREKFVLRKSSAFSCYRTVFLGQAPRSGENEVQQDSRCHLVRGACLEDLESRIIQWMTARTSAWRLLVDWRWTLKDGPAVWYRAARMKLREMNPRSGFGHLPCEESTYLLERISNWMCASHPLCFPEAI